MSDKLITRRALRRLLMISPQQFDSLELDKHLERFTGKGKGYAICYRLKDVERYLSMKIPLTGLL